jgi:hypothetical protein
LIDLTLTDNKLAYLPGEAITGTLSWQCEKELEAIELRLCWKTSGKGSTDNGMADSLLLKQPQTHGNMPFELHFPSGPYSFSGKLISISWYIEVVADPTSAGRSTKYLTMSPTGKELGLHDWKQIADGGYLQP